MQANKPLSESPLSESPPSESPPSESPPSESQQPKRQLHKRLPHEFIQTVLLQFNQHTLSEKKATQLLGISRARLYVLRKRWVDSQRRGETFIVYRRQDSSFHEYSAEEATFLHEQLAYIQQEHTTTEDNSTSR